MKKCPYCAEQIMDEAVLCKHCGKDLKHKPKKEKHRSPVLNCFIVLIIIIVMIVIASFNLSHSRKKAENQNINVTTKPRITETVFDVPELMGKSYNQITAVLGEPASGFEPTPLQVSMGVSASASYESPSGIGLLFDYTDANQPVRYFFLSNKDYRLEELKIAANLSSTAYKMISQPDLTTGQEIIGIHICDIGYAGDDDISGSENCKK